MPDMNISQNQVTTPGSQLAEKPTIEGTPASNKQKNAEEVRKNQDPSTVGFEDPVLLETSLNKLNIKNKLSGKLA